MRYVDTQITFSEIPDEVSMCISVSGCKNNCKGCHSPHLADDIGNELTAESISTILFPYEDYITSVCFLGHGEGFSELASSVKKMFPNLKVGLYSGSDEWDDKVSEHLDYYKIGSYIEYLGGLDSPTTNQRMYKRDGEWKDITYKFLKGGKGEGKNHL